MGKAVGSALPIPGLAEPLGNAASWLARAFGFGRYSIRKNSLMTQNIAQFADNGSMTFAHREFVTDVFTSVDFANTGYLINPGNPQLFPWLSRIAQNYEEFEFLGLIFEFKSMSADAVGSTNTGLGTLIMATDYDVVDANYATKQEMEIADFATSDAPCYHQIHPVECDPKQNVMKKMFVQTATTLAGYPDDPRFSVLGNFQIAAVGAQSPSRAGELWVSYHIRLSKPQLARGIAAQPATHLRAHVTNSTGQVIDSTSSYPNNNGVVFLYDTNGGMTIKANNSLGIGTYLVAVRSQGVTNTGTLAIDSISTSNGGGFIANEFYYLDGTVTADGYSSQRNLSMQNFKGGSFYNSSGGCGTALINLSAVGSAVRVGLTHCDTDTIYHDVFCVPFDHTNITKPLSGRQQMKQQLNDIHMKLVQMGLLSPIGSPEPPRSVQPAQICTIEEETSPEYCSIDQVPRSLVSRIPGIGAFNLQLPGSARRA